MIEEKLQYQLRVDRVRAMKSPAILMNNSDLEELQEELKKRTNIKFSSIICYEGIPITANDSLTKGSMLVYDQINNLSIDLCFAIEEIVYLERTQLKYDEEINMQRMRGFTSY